MRRAALVVWLAFSMGPLGWAGSPAFAEEAPAATGKAAGKRRVLKRGGKAKAGFARRRKGRAVVAAPAPEPAAPVQSAPAAVEEEATPDAAKRRDLAGQAHYDAGRYDKALAEFIAADRAHSTPGRKLQIARTQEKLGRRKEALGNYRLVADRSPDPFDADEARNHVRVLAAQAEAPAAGPGDDDDPFAAKGEPAAPVAAAPSPVAPPPIAAAAPAKKLRGKRRLKRARLGARKSKKKLKGAAAAAP